MLNGRHFLHVPGPTNIPERVIRAMTTTMEDQRGANFPKFTKPLYEDMKKIFKLSKKYKFKVIEDASHAVGATYKGMKIGKPQKDSLPEGYTRFTINEQLTLILANPKNLSEFKLTSESYWRKACIDSFIPEVNFASTETYVPQMLNLDINEVGVNFSKGCFPGQEVIARLHYLGKAKRRLFVFKTNTEIKDGDDLFCPSSESAKACGRVVVKVKFETDYFCLATLEVAHKDDQIYLNNEQGPTLTRINYE